MKDWTQDDCAGVYFMKLSRESREEDFKNPCIVCGQDPCECSIEDDSFDDDDF